MWLQGVMDMLYKNYATHCDQPKQQTDKVQNKGIMSLYQYLHDIFETGILKRITHKIHGPNWKLESSLPYYYASIEPSWLMAHADDKSDQAVEGKSRHIAQKCIMNSGIAAKTNKTLLTLILTLVFSSSYGVDFGNHGNVFVIQEEDARETFIKSAARVDWEGPREQIRESIIELKANKQNKRALYPPNEDIITFIDPSITAQRDIYAPYIKEGQVERELLIAKGTKINPLDYMQPSTHRLFINAEDPYQLELLNKMVNDYSVALQIIVVNGSTEKVEKASKINVFQASNDLLEKNNIDFTPSIVSVSNHPNYLKRMQVTSLARPFSTERLIELISYE
mgnify:CR=1 FL=1